MTPGGFNYQYELYVCVKVKFLALLKYFGFRSHFLENPDLIIALAKAIFQEVYSLLQLLVGTAVSLV